MIIERRMDDQLQPLMPPFEGPSNAIPDEGKTCHHCYKLPDGVHLLRAFSVDHGTGNASQNTRGERKVITKASSSHKFTIINYGRSSIPNNSFQTGDNLDSIVAVTPEREDSSAGVKLISGELKLPDRVSQSESIRDSGIENTSEKLHELVDRIKGEQKDKDFVLTITPSSQNVSLKLPEISPTVSPSDQNVKNSLTPFFSTVQATKCPSGQQSYWKNKTSRWNEIAKIGRIFTKRNKLRLIQQSGECNVMYSNVHRKNVRYLTDLFTTLMELKWRYNILFYLVSFVMSWIMFALLWLGLHCAYGLDENQVPCVEGVRDFKTALLFSIETQQTIGYGTRSVSDRCLLSYFLLMLQSVFGAITQCVVTGIVFSKLARPDKRAETVIFSKRAVICQGSKEPGAYLNLEFRVGDIRNSQLIGVRINAVLVRKSFENSGRQVELQQKCLKITTESEDDFYFLAWPIKVIHRIDPTSPFWNTTPQDVALADFEILIVLEANCESTGGTVQVKTSYLPSEIVWGGKLAPLFTRTKFNGRYKVDYSRFDEITTDDSLYDHGDNCERVQVDRDIGEPGLTKPHHPLGGGNNFKLEQNSLASLALDDSSP